jgi:glycosyltransferase involved in cell wall biosynthesis
MARHPMRIVRYYPRAVTGDGGMTGAVRCWSREFVKSGAEAVIAFDGGPKPVSSDGVTWARVRHSGSGPWRSPADLEKILRGADVLILNSAWAYHNIRAARAARRLGVPYVLEPRGAYDPHIVNRRRLLKQLWWKAWEGDLVAHARAIHLFFEDEHAHLDALGYRGRTIVAPNGVERPKGLAWDGGSDGNVLWLGRFDVEHKGIDLLVRAMQLIPSGKRPRLRLHGPDSQHRDKLKVRQLVRALGLEPWVSVEAPIHGPEKFELLSRALGFVYPSRWEGFGNSVAEAVSLGVPTVVTPYPLGRRLASQGAAFLAEPTPPALAAGLLALSSPEAPKVGRRGAELAREELGWDHVARSWLRQVEALL